MVSSALCNIISKVVRPNLVLKQSNKPSSLYYSALFSNLAKTKPPLYKEIKDKIKRKRPWNALRTVIPLFALTTSGPVVFLILLLGAPDVDEEGKIIRDDLSDEPIAKQYVLRTYREIKYYWKLLQSPSTEKLLPDPLEAPYKQSKYTLVIELTDVLVHPEWTYSVGWRYKKRPLLDHFLEDLKGSYEIVLYTTEPGSSVFSLMDVIDPNNIIAYKLVRGTTKFTGLGHIKELNRLNRDLKKVICIDWNAKRVRQNQENLLKVKRWDGRDDDTSLLDLAAFLKTITDSQIEDVREVLKYYSKYNDPVEAFRKKQEMLIEELEEAAKRGNKRKPHTGFKLFS